MVCVSSSSHLRITKFQIITTTVATSLPTFVHSTYFVCMEYMESCGIHDVLVHTIASFMNQPISAATKKIVISIQRAMSGRCLNTNFMLAK